MDHFEMYLACQFLKQPSSRISPIVHILLVHEKSENCGPALPLTYAQKKIAEYFISLLQLGVIIRGSECVK